MATTMATTLATTMATTMATTLDTTQARSRLHSGMFLIFKKTGYNHKQHIYGNYTEFWIFFELSTNCDLNHTSITKFPLI